MTDLEEVMKGIKERHQAHIARMRKANALPTRSGPLKQDDKELKPNDDVLQDPSQA